MSRFLLVGCRLVLVLMLQAVAMWLVVTKLRLGTRLWLEMGFSLEEVWSSMWNRLFVGIEGR